MECPSSNKHRDAVRKNDRLMQQNDSPNRDCGDGGDDDRLADARDAVLLSTDTRRRLARRGGGVRDVSAFNSLFNAELHEDTDGCAERYRSATSLYMLSKFAFENDLVYCRAIDAEGHVKKSIDGLSGNDKADLDKALRGLVEYQPRQGGDTRGRRTAGDDGEGSSTASGEKEDGDVNF